MRYAVDAAAQLPLTALDCLWAVRLRVFIILCGLLSLSLSLPQWAEYICHSAAAQLPLTGVDCL